MRPHLIAAAAGGLALLAATAFASRPPGDADPDDRLGDRAGPEPRAPRPSRRADPLAGDEGPQLYAPDEARPFGPYHNDRRPRGLPLFVATAEGLAGRVRIDELSEARARGTAKRVYTSRHKHEPASLTVRPVRRASAARAAIPHVERIALEAGLGRVFVATMVNLARREGEGGTFAVPARNFNAGCQNTLVDAQRRCTVVDTPRSGRLVTAWGVFQFNRDAGRDLHRLNHLGLQAPQLPTDWMPWDWTADEELRVPIDYYAQLWTLQRRRGASERDAARGVRLWHTGPSRFVRYLSAGGNAIAWARVDATIAKRIDSHLADAGVA